MAAAEYASSADCAPSAGLAADIGGQQPHPSSQQPSTRLSFGKTTRRPPAAWTAITCCRRQGECQGEGSRRVCARGQSPARCEGWCARTHRVPGVPRDYVCNGNIEWTVFPPRVSLLGRRHHRRCNALEGNERIRVPRLRSLLVLRSLQWCTLQACSPHAGQRGEVRNLIATEYCWRVDSPGDERC